MELATRKSRAAAAILASCSRMKHTLMYWMHKIWYTIFTSYAISHHHVSRRIDGWIFVFLRKLRESMSGPRTDVMWTMTDDWWPTVGVTHVRQTSNELWCVNSLRMLGVTLHIQNNTRTPFCFWYAIAWWILKKFRGGPPTPNPLYG